MECVANCIVYLENHSTNYTKEFHIKLIASGKCTGVFLFSIDSVSIMKTNSRKNSATVSTISITSEESGSVSADHPSSTTHKIVSTTRHRQLLQSFTGASIAPNKGKKRKLQSLDPLKEVLRKRPPELLALAENTNIEENHMEENRTTLMPRTAMNLIQPSSDTTKDDGNLELSPMEIERNNEKAASYDENTSISIVLNVEESNLGIPPNTNILNESNNNISHNNSNDNRNNNDNIKDELGNSNDDDMDSTKEDLTTETWLTLASELTSSFTQKNLHPFAIELILNCIVHHKNTPHTVATQLADIIMNTLNKSTNSCDGVSEIESNSKKKSSSKEYLSLLIREYDAMVAAIIPIKDICIRIARKFDKINLNKQWDLLQRKIKFCIVPSCMILVYLPIELTLLVKKYSEISKINYYNIFQKKKSFSKGLQANLDRFLLAIQSAAWTSSELDINWLLRKDVSFESNDDDMVVDHDSINISIKNPMRVGSGGGSSNEVESMDLSENRILNTLKEFLLKQYSVENPVLTLLLNDIDNQLLTYADFSPDTPEVPTDISSVPLGLQVVDGDQHVNSVKKQRKLVVWGKSIASDEPNNVGVSETTNVVSVTEGCGAAVRPNSTSSHKDSVAATLPHNAKEAERFPRPPEEVSRAQAAPPTLENESNATTASGDAAKQNTSKVVSLATLRTQRVLPRAGLTSRAPIVRSISTSSNYGNPSTSIETNEDKSLCNQFKDIKRNMTTANTIPHNSLVQQNTTLNPSEIQYIRRSRALARSKSSIFDDRQIVESTPNIMEIKKQKPIRNDAKEEKFEAKRRNCLSSTLLAETLKFQ